MTNAEFWMLKGMMRLGISSYTYGWAVAQRRLGVGELIARAKEFGVGVLQICDNLPQETYSDGSVREIARRAQENGISIELGTRGCSPGHLRRFIGHAVTLESPVLRVVLDTAGDHPWPEEAVRRIREVRGELEEAGVTLAIENHDRFQSAVLAQLVRDCGTENVGICLDTVNSFGAMEGPEVVVNTLGPLVVNIHLKDSAVARFGHLQGFTVEGRAAGTGMLDIPWLLKKGREFGWTCNAILEQWVSPEGAMEQTIEKEAQWATIGVSNVRRWIRE